MFLAASAAPSQRSPGNVSENGGWPTQFGETTATVGMDLPSPRLQSADMVQVCCVWKSLSSFTPKSDSTNNWRLRCGWWLFFSFWGQIAQFHLILLETWTGTSELFGSYPCLECACSLWEASVYLSQPSVRTCVLLGRLLPSSRWCREPGLTMGSAASPWLALPVWAQDKCATATELCSLCQCGTGTLPNSSSLLSS